MKCFITAKTNVFAHALLCRPDDNLVVVDFHYHFFIVDMLPLRWNENILRSAAFQQSLSVFIRFAHLSLTSFQSIKEKRGRGFIKI